jgi:hypothetical protein
MRIGAGSPVKGCEASAAYRRHARARTCQIGTAFTCLHRRVEAGKFVTSAHVARCGNRNSGAPFTAQRAARLTPRQAAGAKSNGASHNDLDTQLDCRVGNQRDERRRGTGLGRLGRLLAALPAPPSPIFSTSHDHKGELSVEWRTTPTDE